MIGQRYESRRLNRSKHIGRMDVVTQFMPRRLPNRPHELLVFLARYMFAGGADQCLHPPTQPRRDASSPSARSIPDLLALPHLS